MSGIINDQTPDEQVGQGVDQYGQSCTIIKLINQELTNQQI
jgi:hypothetical protein